MNIKCTTCASPEHSVMLLKCKYCGELVCPGCAEKFTEIGAICKDCYKERHLTKEVKVMEK